MISSLLSLSIIDAACKTVIQAECPDSKFNDTELKTTYENDSKLKMFALISGLPFCITIDLVLIT